MKPAQSLPHDAAREHVTGSARYIDDIPVPTDCLHLAFGLSTISAGRIMSMGLDAVRTADGVVAVIVADDLPFANDVSPSAHDEPLLSDGDIHYHGQPIFAVAATSHLAARKAAVLGQIQYEERTPILTVDEAIMANSRFEDGPRIYTKGDVAEGLSKALHTLHGTLEVGGQEHFYLEGQAALALPGDGGDMIVHSSTQHPTEIQHKVAEALGLPFNMVTIQTRRMGGGFGGKESQGNALAVACAVVAQRTSQPCKMRYDRDDDFVITGKRHDCRISYDVGFDDQGRIQAVDFTHLFRCGWAQDLSLPVADRAMLHADNAYDLPHARITSHRLKTNTASATAFRGFGGPQGMVGIERVVDHVAHFLGLDPAAVRQANYYPTMENGNASGGSFSGNRMGTTPYGMEVSDFVLDKLTDRLVETSDYDARRRAVAAWNAQSGIIRKGIAFSPVKFGISFTLTHLNQAGALVQIYADGSVLVNHGGTEMGQGLFQKVAQVAVRELGVLPDTVRPSATDTSKVPNTSATAASSGADLNGMAVLKACEVLRGRLADLLRDLHGVEDIRFEGGRVTADGLDMSFAKVVALAYQNRVSLSATGFYKTPDIEWDRIKGHGRPFYYFAYGCSVSEVAVDTLTGEYNVLRTDILHDCGNSLNPTLDKGQIEGAYVQGMGWLTTEELVWDDAGHLRTHAPSTYKIPAMSDRPDVFNVNLWDGPNPVNTVHRSKAVGEPPFMHGISAFLALSHAVASCGPAYPDLQAPATFEEVFHAIQRTQA
ncbi:MAG: xanthine dehydrogenase molybdopterin binding subunit [Planktomarina sp.]